MLGVNYGPCPPLVAVPRAVVDSLGDSRPTRHYSTKQPPAATVSYGKRLFSDLQEKYIFEVFYIFCDTSG